MKNVVDAIRYGMETLKVSSDEMFSLIKSANTDEDLTGNYKLWLAREIVKIAEKEGVGYSQLLVKKFSIIQEILNSSEVKLKDSWVHRIMQEVSGKDGSLFTVGLEELNGLSLDGVDWQDGVDYDVENAFFTDTLPEQLKSKIKNNEGFSLVARLSSEPCSKKCDVALDAKARSVSVKTLGGALLYRLCLLSDVHGLESGKFSFAFLVNSEFLVEKVNQEVIRYFLLYFNCTGYIVKSADLYADISVDGEYSVVFCKPRDIGDNASDTLNLTCPDGLVRRYSFGKAKYVDVIKSNQPGVDCGVSLCVESPWKIGIGVSGDIRVGLENLEDCITYYGVVSSLMCFGFSRDIGVMASGGNNYRILLSNCIPLFLYDDGSELIPGLEGNLGDRIHCLRRDYMVYFSYEAKELEYVVSSIMKKASEEGISVQGKSLNQIRRELKDSTLDESYTQALRCLKGYIKSLYREMVV